MKPFIPLHINTCYSFLESTVRIDDIIDYCKSHHVPAAAITDHSLHAVMHFSSKMLKEHLQPIIGCSLTVTFEDVYAPLIFIARTQEGYQNLVSLSTFSHMATLKEEKNLSLPHLVEKHSGLICLTGGNNGLLETLLKHSQSRAQSLLEQLQNIFGSFLFIEFQRHTHTEKNQEENFIHLAKKMSLPLLASQSVHFTKRDHYDALKSLIAIGKGTLVDDYAIPITQEQFMKSPEEMHALFSDYPMALSNTVELAKSIDFFLDKKPLRMPHLPEIGPHLEEGAFEKKAKEGLENLQTRAQIPWKTLTIQDYQKRLDYEINVIKKTKFSGYFLIVADFVTWAKEHGIPVGPGRGSGVGSLVAYSLGITAIDPLRFDLVFERFINPARISPPDFDIDLCREHRERVIEFIKKRHGKEKVAQIITFGSLQSRSVLRDLGRVFGISYARIDALCRTIPPLPTISLKEAKNRYSRLKTMLGENKDLERIFQLGQILEGLPRHISTHAAGVIISDQDLKQTIPLCLERSHNDLITQLSMEWLEYAGLIKFDLLGLKTLTTIDTIKKILLKDGTTIHFEQLPLDDLKTFQTLQKGDGTGIFQLESASAQAFMKKMQPKSFEDICALIALHRPGPMDNFETFVACKQGKKKPHILHPHLKDILRETYGIIVYQEQVIRIAQIIAGYSAGEADILRKAMGKKMPEEMEKQRQRFLQGAENNQIDSQLAQKIFKNIERFAGYGFNKAHAVAYGMLSYWTAYAKTHYPNAFFLASMQADRDNTERLSVLMENAKLCNVRINPPDINTSEQTFILKEEIIFYGLGSLKNVGEKAMLDIVKERKENGLYKDVEDFFKRQEKVPSKNALESIISAGAFDCFDQNRNFLMENLPLFVKLTKNSSQNNQPNLFDDIEGGSSYKNVPSWSREKILLQEFKATGLYLTGHPLDTYKNILMNEKIQKRSDPPQSQKWQAGVIMKVAMKRSRKGGEYCHLILSDKEGTARAILFPKQMEHIQKQPDQGDLLLYQRHFNDDTNQPFRISRVKSLISEKISSPS